MEELKKFYDYYDMEISACEGSKRAEFIQSIKADLKPCKVVSIRELFNDLQIDAMRTLVEQKQCFKLILPIKKPETKTLNRFHTPESKLMNLNMAVQQHTG